MQQRNRQSYIYINNSFYEHQLNKQTAEICLLSPPHDASLLYNLPCMHADAVAAAATAAAVAVAVAAAAVVAVAVAVVRL